MQTLLILYIIGLGVLERTAIASPLRPPSARQDNTDGRPWAPELSTTSPDKRDDLHRRNEINRGFIDNSCSVEVKEWIFEAWEEARLLNDAQTYIQPEYNYDIPHTQWLGKDWNQRGWLSPNYGGRVEENFRRVRKFFSKRAPQDDLIYFTCSDPMNYCIDKEGDTVEAYQFSDPGWVISKHYINFCPSFGLWQYSLKLLIEDATLRPHKEKVINWFQASRAGALYHEIWHMHPLVSVPRAVDFAYQPQAAWELARDHGAKRATINADSYHMNALAIYVQQHFGLSAPPIPYREAKSQDPEAFNAVEEPPESNYTSIVIESVDLKLVEGIEYEDITLKLWPETDTADPGNPGDNKEEPVQCQGATDTKYIVRDKILNIIDQDFCNMAESQEKLDDNSGSISRRLFAGTVNELEIAMDWAPGLDFKPKADDCKRYMREITDSCNTTTDRFKGGGEKQVGQVKYRWKPEAEHTFWAGCEYTHNFLKFSYTVWGAGWGHDGGHTLSEHVKDFQVAATAFDFNYGGGEDDREWTATFDGLVESEWKVEEIIEKLTGHDWDVKCA